MLEETPAEAGCHHCATSPEQTHRAKLAWLCDVMQHDGSVVIKYAGTKQQCADRLAIGFTNVEHVDTWNMLLSIIAVLRMYKHIVVTKSRRRVLHPFEKT